MKLREKALIGLMALSLAGGVATTFALSATAGTGTANGSVDSAIYLNWSDTSGVADIEGLKNGIYVYRSIGVAAPQMSKGVTGKQGQLTFTLAASDDDHTIDGTTIYIATSDLQSESDHEKEPWTTATVLNKTSTTYSVTLTDAATYYLAFTKVADDTEEEAGKEVGATLTMSLSIVDVTTSE